jgi:hypothetical protein
VPREGAVISDPNSRKKKEEGATNPRIYAASPLRVFIVAVGSISYFGQKLCFWPFNSNGMHMLRCYSFLAGLGLTKGWLSGLRRLFAKQVYFWVPWVQIPPPSWWVAEWSIAGDCKFFIPTRRFESYPAKGRLA